tara:strand:+ start:350 stop:520 length:171 start_codon:yes stop_codon:yes gene_type:complete
MIILHQDSIFKVKEGLTTMKESLGPVPSTMEAYEIDHNVVAPKRPTKASTNSFPGD